MRAKAEMNQALGDAAQGCRIFICPACGLIVDRGLNAAHNLVWWAK